MLYEDADGATHAVDSPTSSGSRWAGSRAGDVLADHARHGVEVAVLGDAARPSDFVAAINAGADAGLAL